MKHFKVIFNTNKRKVVLYPFDEIKEIKAELNPDFSSEFTKITLKNDRILKVRESIDEIIEMMDSSFDEDMSLTAYIKKK